MENIFASHQINNLLELTQGKKIVLVGGCFDILHIGHITFLQKSKEKGGNLIVLLESDQHIKKIKGDNRPVNSQNDRAKILAALRSVDFVVKLPEMKDTDYDNLVTKINPQIIAITEGDKGLMHKKRQVETIGAKLVIVTSEIADQSTTRVLNLLEEL